MRAPWIAAWIAWVVLVGGASPAYFWLDAGEIGAAGFELGVIHPPGAPGLGLLLRATSIVPWGSLGFRMALLDCALGAVTVGLVVAVLRRRGASEGVAMLAGLWVITGLTFVRHARVIEIYALAGALSMVTIWGFDPAVRAGLRTGPRLLGVAAATWAAWCFGDLRLVLVPLLGVGWIIARKAQAPWARWAPLVSVLMSLVVLTVPLASLGGPRCDWGDPQTMSRLFDHLTAASIRRSFADQIIPASWSIWCLHARQAFERLVEDLGGPGLLMALVGGWWVGRPEPGACARQTRATAWALRWWIAVELVYIVGINPMGGDDRQTGLVLAPLAAVLVGDGMRRWWACPRSLWTTRVVHPIVVVALLVPPLVYSAPDHGVTRSWAPHAWTRAAFEGLPPGALLLTQSDDLAAGSLAAAVLEGARPDVISIPAQHLYRPTPEAAEADPRRKRLWDAAHTRATESGRIEAVLEAHPEAVALESARAGIFAAVPWFSDHGRLPLSIDRSGLAPRGLPGVKSDIVYWLARLPSPDDRRRLAIAVAHWARARIRSDPFAMAQAAAALELSLTQIDPEHASALVTLATLWDRAGDSQGAIGLTRQALVLEPGRAAALLNLALYLSRRPQTRDEALEYAKRAVALRPWRADGWRRLAEIQRLRGEHGAATRSRARAEAITTSR